jgi:hypothetical protein
MGMAINVYQRLLRHAQQGQGAGVTQPGDITTHGERGLDAGPASEATHKRLNGGGKPAIGEISGIMQEREGPYLATDLARDVLDFMDKAGMLGIFDLQAGDAQLQARNELTG